MAEQFRSCRRTACRWPAVASLSFRYETRQVWLEDLPLDADPSRWDLCPHHADKLVVPRGWERVDQRSSRPALPEPSARDRDRARHRTAPVTRPRRRNRYAELSAALPALAAAVAGGHDDMPSPSHVPSAHAPSESPRLVPSRELAPTLFEAESPEDGVVGKATGVVVPFQAADQSTERFDDRGQMH